MDKIIAYMNGLQSNPNIEDILINMSTDRDANIVIILKDDNQYIFNKNNIQSGMYIQSFSIGISHISFAKGKMMILGKNGKTYYVKITTREQYELETKDTIKGDK